MQVFLCSAIFVLNLIVTPQVAARTVDWSTELSADLALIALTYGVQRNQPKSAIYNGTEFPTQGSDDYVAKVIHGEPTGDETTKKEHNYREASNVTVFAAGALPVVLGLGKGRPEFAAKAMTVTHTLLLSNFIVTGMKYSVRRARPKARHNENLAKGDDALSFPSGHSSAAFAGATLVSLLFPQESIWTKAVAYSLASFTAYARIAGDKHFFVDVLTGSIIGSGSALLTVNLLEQRDEKDVSLVIEQDAIGLAYKF